MPIVIRSVAPDELADMAQHVSMGFGHDASPHYVESVRTLVDPSRTYCAFENQKLVGTCGAFEFTLSLPGGQIPMAGTTMVTVSPSHRRRGVMRQMMSAHLEDSVARGDSLVGLWASEGGIYGRFGFGPAAIGQRITINARTAQWGGGAIDGLDVASPDQALPILTQLYDKAFAARPGFLKRSEDWWRLRILNDDPDTREGASKLRIATYSNDRGPEGYAIYRQRSTDPFGEGELLVNELVALTGAAHQGLWRFVCEVDLFPRAVYWNAPTDDEVIWRVGNAYAVRREAIDNLWLRPVDVAAVLAARRYHNDGELTIKVVDDWLGRAQTWHLAVAGGVATVSPSEREPEIVLSIGELGALALGRRVAFALHRAGRIRRGLGGARGAVASLDRLLSGSLDPWCPEVF